MSVDTTYLDHAGTTLYAKSLIESFSRDLTENLFGNPHSASAASQLSSRRIDDTRLQVLRFLNADPDDFDVVFVANATAAIKLVADAFHDNDDGFWYGYHAESHTSLVGVRELARQGCRCFVNDHEVETWIAQTETGDAFRNRTLHLFGYPGQSNMTGHRLPTGWCKRLRKVCETSSSRFYTIYDAAGLFSTSSLDLSDATSAPDFVALSFYKCFGFPDLGALIVRKESADILRRRKYFGGGTVDMVVALDQQWHAKRTSSLHSQLEDGTVALHNIIALQTAIATHKQIYGSMENISRHCHFLHAKLYRELTSLRHGNGRAVCKLYTRPFSTQDCVVQGPIIAFNLRNHQGEWIGKSEVEKLATVHGIQLRTGGLCNPGGVATYLELTSEEMRQNFGAGQRCGDDHDILHGRPTGAVRISLGAMSSMRDVDTFVNFVRDFFVEGPSTPPTDLHPCLNHERAKYVVESLSVYPIKSCAAFKIPQEASWEVFDTGLAWDREWCLVHQGTGEALSQKRYPKMALLRPSLSLDSRVLRVEHDIEGTSLKTLDLPLDDVLPNSTFSASLCNQLAQRQSDVCGNSIGVEIYTSPVVSNFFSEALDVLCTLARLRRVHPRPNNRRPSLLNPANESPGSFSNESPILLINRSSVNRLNEDIKRNPKTGAGKAVTADSFRGNIVITEELEGGQAESPYAEDEWTSIQIGEDRENTFDILGPCQRCQMVCVDQNNAQRRREPFSTLAKTRRRDGKVWFGSHLTLSPMQNRWMGRIRAGDYVQPATSATTVPSLNCDR